MRGKKMVRKEEGGEESKRSFFPPDFWKTRNR